MLLRSIKFPTSSFRNAPKNKISSNINRISNNKVEFKLNLTPSRFYAKRYTQDHEWVDVNGKIGTVGISDFAQNALGDVVFVDLPEAGKSFSQKEIVVSVESVKAVSSVYAPVSGKLKEANQALTNEPSLVNSSPLEKGWMVKLELTNPKELDSLMDETAYKEFCEKADH